MAPNSTRPTYQRCAQSAPESVDGLRAPDASNSTPIWSDVIESFREKGLDPPCATLNNNSFLHMHYMVVQHSRHVGFVCSSPIGVENHAAILQMLHCEWGPFNSPYRAWARCI